MEIKKIITHAGVFHADEVLSIATIMIFENINYDAIQIERKNEVSFEELADPSVIIIDVAQHYEPVLVNFDHHQNGELPASNLLVLEHFCHDIDLKNILKKQLYNYVSDVDKGKVIIKEGGETATFNSIIRNLNNIEEEGFNIAMIIACATLEGYLATAMLSIETKEYYYSLERVLDGKVVIERAGQFIPDWKELAKQEGVMFMISPNARGGWQLVTRDSDEFTIPQHPDPKVQTFLHANGFVAVYSELSYALEDAEQIVIMLTK